MKRVLPTIVIFFFFIALVLLSNYSVQQVYAVAIGPGGTCTGGETNDFCDTSLPNASQCCSGYLCVAQGQSENSTSGSCQRCAANGTTCGQSGSPSLCCDATDSCSSQHLCEAGVSGEGNGCTVTSTFTGSSTDTCQGNLSCNCTPPRSSGQPTTCQGHCVLKQQESQSCTATNSLGTITDDCDSGLNLTCNCIPPTGTMGSQTSCQGKCVKKNATGSSCTGLNNGADQGSCADPNDYCNNGQCTPRGLGSTMTNPCPGNACPTFLGTIDVNTPVTLVNTIFQILLGTAGGVAVILIIVSGYQFILSQGNPEKVKGARERLTAAVIGLLFIIFSVSILQVIGVDILHIPGFTH